MRNKRLPQAQRESLAAWVCLIPAIIIVMLWTAVFWLIKVILFVAVTGTINAATLIANFVRGEGNGVVHS